MALVKADLGEALPLIASGKVRELYDVDSNTLLFVATDRISAYDVIMQNGVPEKGLILTLITAHWFDYLEKNIPGLKTHFISLDLPPAVPRHLIPQLKGRSMLVRKLKVFPVEAIVRGYITGSAWSSYKKTGEVNGRKMPQDLQESQELPEPIYTPSTKAELGQHDENISTEQAAQIVGEKYAKRIEELSLSIYKAARDYAKEKGIIIADTKFEFGLDEATDEVVLVDEVLTPDSSRFWSKETYKVGQSQDSFDKQFLRDWLTKNGLKGKEGVTMPQDVVDATRAKYLEAFKILTGKTLEETLQELK
ncbi:Phosphoribosylaminoimidazole-succinocarboxamide synthase [Exophiala dermatitidis]|uniref:Phosphoribosylaminoimidazole-succinocarboxamide synthase n=1 Tax=Exophiala dermatitidis (strain ATCC 34100 / CBS 525.76 / NIH/UT8656) TaxID=858893 RepID=H6CAS6_EXODN|nr:phosphoribosylaminoimidazole-succinocarboxamide synthase [Exophiala dermatitidis NIH/UT8656]EHY60873.1 phosphoribosylaminoimidazole-succinocarboxamide synthase [Exophiala dermatitidis NIH/UT8656]